VRRDPYIVGATFGNLRILEVSKRTYVAKLDGYSRFFHYLICECIVCGTVSEHTRSDLSEARKLNRKHCRVCMERNLNFAPHTTSKMCPVCCDLGERRSHTIPCKGCGKLFEREVLYREECMINRSPIALAQGMI